MVSPYLEVSHVSKQFVGHKALDDLNFTVPRGSIFGLLGPNGAGKTSLIRIITNITNADSGQVKINQKLSTDIPLGQIGYMPEERGLYKKMKVADHLEFFCKLRNIPDQEAVNRIDFWLNKLKIEKWAHKKVEELSKGMQQKIQFIATILHKPELLILDEPFSGLDPVNTDLLKDILYEINQDGTTILFSTHRMEQVEEICDHIVLINKGKNVLQGSVAQVRQEWKDNIFELEFSLPMNADELPSSFRLLNNSTHGIKIQCNDLEQLNLFIAHKINTGNYLTGMKELLPGLNEIFIKTVQSSEQ